jgi:hypothetical protein
MCEVGTHSKSHLDRENDLFEGETRLGFTQSLLCLLGVCRQKTERIRFICYSSVAVENLSKYNDFPNIEYGSVGQENYYHPNLRSEALGIPQEGVEKV